MVSPWRGAGPELLIIGAAVTATAVAGYAVGSWTGLTLVVAGAAAASWSWCGRQRRGVPRRTLARLIDRLEEL
jgi:hypothetical protein